MDPGFARNHTAIRGNVTVHFEEEEENVKYAVLIFYSVMVSPTHPLYLSLAHRQS